MDQHHIGGRANSPITISIPANDHRAELSVLQQDWPKETLENPEGCPLRKGAACIRGFRDTLVHLIDQFLLWVADMLERVSAKLLEECGTRWWLQTDIKEFAPNGGLDGKS
jgi:hypothetical protein